MDFNYLKAFLNINAIQLNLDLYKIQVLELTFLNLNTF